MHTFSHPKSVFKMTLASPTAHTRSVLGRRYGYAWMTAHSKAAELSFESGNPLFGLSVSCNKSFPILQTLVLCLRRLRLLVIENRWNAVPPSENPFISADGPSRELSLPRRHGIPAMIGDRRKGADDRFSFPLTCKDAQAKEQGKPSTKKSNTSQRRKGP